MGEPTFQPGFRFSLIDAAVLVIGVVASIVLASTTAWLSFLIAFVIAHFFLFCNVFRIARPLELAWSVAFVVLTYCSVALGSPSWGVTVAVTLLVTAIVIVVEMRKPSYHGIQWRRINPSLPEWWSAHKGRET